MKFKFIKAALAGSVLTVSGFANSALVLLVDLTVANQITISATAGTSFATVNGSDTVGFYLTDFFDSTDVYLSDTLVTGNLTSANETSDNSPLLYSEDIGLNIWSFTNDPQMTFTAGSVAFIGQATWNIDASSYASALAGALAGNVFAPADELSALQNAAALIGTWEVTTAEKVSAPATLAILALGIIGVASRRFKK